MSVKTQYNVLIIGAGNIGAFFDTPVSKNILTHAHAFKKHKGFNLLGFIDVDETKARKAAQLWKCRSFKNIDAAFSSERIDVACVAAPDDYHYDILKELSGFPLKIVFAEKPLAKTITEAKKIMRIYKEKKIDMIVNYSRHFVPEFEKIKADIADGDYGEYLTGTGYYGKGIIHNGSHLIDLLRYFIGEIKKIKPVSGVSDFYRDDKSVSAVLFFENSRPFFLQYADCRKYSMFEIDMLFEKKRIRIYDLGFKIEEYSIRDSKTFKGYKNIVKTSETNSAFSNALYNAAENIYKHLSEGQVLKCTAEDGYLALETCIRIKEAMQN